ncbi:MAG: calcium-translocating P-type ATPase, PMCA-type [Rikenellaceae bacterium]|nr:calcium-translocating P-type ATPase, PMCA-type [Rikenellaceae bacterium]
MAEGRQDLRGLNKQQIKESREKYGENILTPPDKEPVWRLFLEKFEDPVIRILLIAAFLSLGISFVEKEFAETIGIFCAIFLATGVSFWFEYDARKKFDLLGKVDDDTPYKVLRDGEVGQIPKKDIVVGDILILETGEEVPADGTLMESVSLIVNESNLTGEPLASKDADITKRDDQSTYPSYMLMRGSTVVEGYGKLTVTAVGDSTEYGKVARQSAIKPDEKTPLSIQLESLAKFIGVIGFSLAFLTFILLFLKDIFIVDYDYTAPQIWTLCCVLISLAVMSVKIWVPILYDGFELAGKKKQVPVVIDKLGWIKWIIIGLMVFFILSAAGYLFDVDPLEGGSWLSLESTNRLLRYFMVAVTLIVVAVPEGLPMSVTLSLALSMRRMLKTNNLVRNMHACETMGAATVICTDKTGTLTQNRMTVEETQYFSLADQKLSGDAISNLIAEGIAVNSTAFLEKTDGIKVIGNPTEGALLLWLDSFGVDYIKIRESTDIMDQLTFNTERKYMATLVDNEGGKMLYIKGAPEIVLSKCSKVLINGSEVPVEEYEHKIAELTLKYQRKAMRTLGFAYCNPADEVSKCEEAMERCKLVFLGIVAIMDPVREDVPEAVEKCLDAGIDIKIVTGDTPATAREIASRIGLFSADDGDENIITGTEFENTPDENISCRLGEIKIMARARPSDKQRLVQLLQKNGEIVAVTGDGTNDAPALNFAHVGLSMGSGTSVAKEASDITLLDDSFGSIATAVMWGRSLYKNIQRFVLFQLTINFTAIIIVFAGSIFGTEFPLTVTQMLWVNLIMDTFAACALASLPPDPRVMTEKPRRATDFIVNREMKNKIILTGSLFVLVLAGMLFYFGREVDIYQLSVFFTVFVMLQFWNMFNAKAFGSARSAFSSMSESKVFLFILLIILAGQIFIVNYAGEIFRTVPINFRDWILIIAATSSVLWIGEFTRWRRRKRAYQH